MSELMGNFCRICLENCEQKSPISLYETCWVYNKTYQYLLEECTSYKVSGISVSISNSGCI